MTKDKLESRHGDRRLWTLNKLLSRVRILHGGVWFTRLISTMFYTYTNLNLFPSPPDIKNIIK